MGDHLGGETSCYRYSFGTQRSAGFGSLITTLSPSEDDPPPPYFEHDRYRTNDANEPEMPNGFTIERSSQETSSQPLEDILNTHDKFIFGPYQIIYDASDRPVILQIPDGDRVLFKDRRNNVLLTTVRNTFFSTRGRTLGSIDAFTFWHFFVRDRAGRQVLEVQAEEGWVFKLLPTGEACGRAEVTSNGYRLLQLTFAADVDLDVDMKAMILATAAELGHFYNGRVTGNSMRCLEWCISIPQCVVASTTFIAASIICLPLCAISRLVHALLNSVWNKLVMPCTGRLQGFLQRRVRHLLRLSHRDSIYYVNI